MNSESYTSASILIVDDDPTIVRLLHCILERAGFSDLSTTTDSREVLQICLWKQPDLVLLDLKMPHLDGLDVMSRLRSDLKPADRPPVVVLTGDVSPDAKHDAFTAGARDFLAKPFDAAEVILRVRNQLEMRYLTRELYGYNQDLEARILDRTRQLERAQVELLERLARAAEFRDDETGEHAQRVGELSARIAGELGLDSEMIELVWRAASLHDLGKIGVPDTILLKPGKLDAEEMSTMREHVRIGADILSGGSSKFLQTAERIALTHHEWWNGAGYLGMQGEEIPIEGRIVAVADVFDALTHERPYKKAWSVDEAIQHIVQARGSHFDPRVVDACLRVLGYEQQAQAFGPPPAGTLPAA